MEAVKKVEQRVDRIIKENPFPLFTIDAELNVLLSNQAFLEFTGYSQDKISALSMKDFRYLKNKGDTVEGTIKSKKRSHGESTIEFPRVPSFSNGTIFPCSIQRVMLKAC